VSGRALRPLGRCAPGERNRIARRFARYVARGRRGVTSRADRRKPSTQLDPHWSIPVCV